METPSEWRNAAQLASAEGRTAEAVAAWRELLWLRPDDLEAMEGLALCGEIKPALEAVQGSLRRNPDQRHANALLGRLWLELAEWDKAEAAFARAEDDDGLQAVASQRGRSTQPGYARHLFNDYAPRFEEALARLGYQAPQLLAAQLAPYLTRDQHIIDLGCGTGLMAPYLKPHAAELVGVDIAEKMLEEAARRNMYDRLSAVDVVAAFNSPAAWDIAVAADVVVYVGDLQPLFCAAAQGLKPGGILALSAEVNGLEEGFILQESKRYAHSPACLRGWLATAGLDEVSLTPAVLRQDRGQPVQGVVLLARRPTV